VGIVDEDIARVREASDIVAVISEHVQLKRVGRRWSGLCPFHAEKSPSFSVNQEEGLYYCFGCQASGDTITFVREVERLDFVAAVEKLATKAGVSLRYTDADEGHKRKRRSVLTAAVAEAAAFYHQRLLSAEDAAPARSYLRSRGFTGEEVRHFQLGWAPEGWDELARALRLPDEVWVESGLGFLNSRNRQTDFFRGRILFPIHDTAGNPVAFGGRILPGAADGPSGRPQPKYKNSAESPIYAKSRTLYALHWAKGHIVAADEAIVCEGYTDVIGFAAAGLPRAVATCGTSLTEDHFRVLRSFARRVVLAFDADAAGQNAAERFYEWERRFEIDVAVADLPPGKDPGDLARDDPEALRRAVAEARPFLEFRVARVLDRANLATAEGRARAAEQALAVIAEHPNDLVRDQYVMEVASRTRLDADRLRAGLGRPGGGAGGGGRGPAGPGRPGGPGAGRDGERGRTGAASDLSGSAGPPRRRRRAPSGPELEALRLLVARPAEIADSLHEVLFDDEGCLAVYRAVTAAGEVAPALDLLGEQDAELLRQVAAADSTAEPVDVVDLLIGAAAERHLVDLGNRARHAEDPLVYSRVVGEVKLLREALADPATAEEAAGQLLTWLAHQHEETA
jgi:DNA primase